MVELVFTFSSEEKLIFSQKKRSKMSKNKITFQDKDRNNNVLLQHYREVQKKIDDFLQNFQEFQLQISPTYYEQLIYKFPFV